MIAVRKQKYFYIKHIILYYYTFKDGKYQIIIFV